MWRRTVLSLAAMAFFAVVEASTDLFSSTDSLRRLFARKSDLTEALTRYVSQLNAEIRTLEAFLDSNYGSDYPFNEVREIRHKEASEYVSNPINAYALIKRTGLKWPKVRDVLMLESNLNESVLLSDLPESGDIEEASSGIFLLQEVYNLDAEKFSEGIIQVPTSHGKDVIGRSSKLNSVDCEIVAKLAFNRGFYDRAVEWMETAIGKSQEETPTRQSEILKTMKAKHDQVLLQKGARGNTWRTFLVPFDEDLAKKKKRFKQIKDKKYMALLNGTNVLALKKEDLWEVFNEGCRGENRLAAKEDGDMKCFHLHYGDPFLRLAPFKLEHLNREPFVGVFHEFVRHDECEALKKATENKLKRSMHGAKVHVTTAKRTSSQVTVSEWEHPHLPKEYDDASDSQRTVLLADVTRAITRRVELAARLKAALFEAGEPYQVANYGVGGFYTHHLDSVGEFNKPMAMGDVKFHLGDRLATSMAYLSDVEVGGATVFPNLGLTIWPKKGNLVFWFNNDRSGRKDRLTYHGGCPVLLGSKWIANKWIRSRAQWRLYPEPATPEKAALKRLKPLTNDLCEMSEECENVKNGDFGQTSNYEFWSLEHGTLSY